jgi:hypothetical protein
MGVSAEPPPVGEPAGEDGSDGQSHHALNHNEHPSGARLGLLARISKPHPRQHNTSPNNASRTGLTSQRTISQSNWRLEFVTTPHPQRTNAGQGEELSDQVAIAPDWSNPADESSTSVWHLAGRTSRDVRWREITTGGGHRGAPGRGAHRPTPGRPVMLSPNSADHHKQDRFRRPRRSRCTSRQRSPADGALREQPQHSGRRVANPAA